MKSIARSLLVIWAMALAVCDSAWGRAGLWGADGHKIVAQIAYDNLTPRARQEVDSLLAGDTLGVFAVWPDDVKHTPTYSWTGPWHYADMPDEADRFEMGRDCPDEGCVVRGVIEYAATLAGANSTRDQRVEALRFLTHYVGDLHQPLHVGRLSDRGGTDLDVRFFNNPRNLHSVWDSGLIQRKGKDWLSYAALLEQQIDPVKKQAWLAVTDPAEWATESHRLAEDFAYRTPSGDFIARDEVLGQDYLDECLPIVEEQLTKAGLRLAQMLNGIYAAPSGGDPTPPPGTAPETRFVGSRKSEVYHFPGCRDVQSIKPDNLVEYSAEPPGKRLHKNCPR